MEKSLEEVKAIFQRIEPVARELLEIAKDFGDNDLVSMSLFGDSVTFFAFDKDEDHIVDATIYRKDGKLDLKVRETHG